MRLWSLHPRLLDRQGLLALWRESLLAQAVLAGRTRGYRNHPQLERFRSTPDPLLHLGAYLCDIAAEADARGYTFNTGKIDLRPRPSSPPIRLPVTRGQVSFEVAHLRSKLTRRSPHLLTALRLDVETHPIFHIVPGPKEHWERG